MLNLPADRIFVNPSVRVAGNTPLPRAVALPQLPGVATLAPEHVTKLGLASPSPMQVPVANAVQGATGAGSDLRVLNWNLHDLKGPSRREVIGTGEAIRRVRQTVRAEKPDVLVLQEVRQNSTAGRGIERLKRELGATDAVFVSNRHTSARGQKGGAVLTFGNTRIQDARGLYHPDSPEPKFLPRTTNDVMVTTPTGVPVRVLGVHLTGPGRAHPNRIRPQRDQVDPVVSTVPAWQGTTIVAGDFNVKGRSVPGRRETELMRSVGLRDAFSAVGILRADPARRSFSTSHPRYAIDRIYVSRDAEVREMRRIDTPATRRTSDHFPLLAVVHVPGRPPA